MGYSLLEVGGDGGRIEYNISLHYNTLSVHLWQPKHQSISMTTVLPVYLYYNPMAAYLPIL